MNMKKFPAGKITLAPPLTLNDNRGAVISSQRSHVTRHSSLTINKKQFVSKRVSGAFYLKEAYEQFAQRSSYKCKHLLTAQ